MPNQRSDNRILIDPRLINEHRLRYNESLRGWHIFRTFFWSIYLIVIGTMLVYYTSIFTSVTLFFGVAFLVFAVMLILYGLTEALHHQLMRKYN